MKIDFQKILETLIMSEHHAVDKIEKVITESKKASNDNFVKLSFEEIVNDDEWNAKEKERLLRIFGYEKEEQKLKYYYSSKDKTEHEMNAFIYMIKTNNLSGFTAYMNCFNDIKKHYIKKIGEKVCISKDEAFKIIINAINGYNGICDDYCFEDQEKLTEEQKLEFLKVSLSILSEKAKKSLCVEVADEKKEINTSIFINIIKTGNMELIDKFVPYIDNISPYLSEAAATGNIEIVRHFIEDLGADINYYPKKVKYDFLNPFKRAIINNDYKMFKFLYEKGGDINLPIQNKKDNKDSKTEDKNAKYLRESSLLEFAITPLSRYKCGLMTNFSSDFFDYDMKFEGETKYGENKFSIKKNWVSTNQINRAKIVNFLFEKSDKNEIINPTNLICLALCTKDIENIDKYFDYVIRNNLEIVFRKIFYVFLELELFNDNLCDKLFGFIEKYSNDASKTFKELFDQYFENKPIFKISDFTEKLLNKINYKDRINIELMPYVRDIKTAKSLMKLGFDINQTTELGENVLFFLLGYLTHDITKEEREFFTFLTKINPENNKSLINIRHKTKANKNALYYALNGLDAKDEYKKTKKEKVYLSYTAHERLVADFIDMLPEEEVDNEDVKEMLENRLTTREYRFKTGTSECGIRQYKQELWMGAVYQHHQKLMKSFRKKMIFTDRVYENIFSNLYYKDRYFDFTEEKIQLEDTLHFIFEVLDKNVEIQKLSIANNYDIYANYINQSNLSFENFLSLFKKLLIDIIELKQFYDQNITKKYSPEKYLDYVKNKYNVSYDNLQSYILKMILLGLRKYGSDKLPQMLELCPFFDINTIVFKEDFGLSAIPYVAISYINNVVNTNEKINQEKITSLKSIDCTVLPDGSVGNVLFTGSLIHYGILINDIELVMYLRNIGAKMDLIIDGEDHSRDYINSELMAKLLGPKVAPINFDEMNEEEREFLRSLDS